MVEVLIDFQGTHVSWADTDKIDFWGTSALTLTSSKSLLSNWMIRDQWKRSWIG